MRTLYTKEFINKHLKMKKDINRLVINTALLISGITSTFSGMLIQIKYHMGNHGAIAIDDSVFRISYHGWTAVHKMSITALSLLVLYHIYKHWKWYKIVITKRLLAKNQQVLVFSLLFILVAITGLVPWIIDTTKGNWVIRKILIEIHDKLAIIMAIYLILHIISRLKWYFTIFEKIKTKNASKDYPHKPEC